MTSDSIDSAARALAAARTERRTMDRLPESCRPETEEDALAIQRGVLAVLGETIGGWKCSTPRAGRSFLAPLPESTISKGARCSVIPYNGSARIEPEIAFVIDTDLPARDAAYTEDEIRAVIGETRLVLEIIGSRYVDPTSLPFPEFLADSIYNQALHLGPLVESALEQQLETLAITVSAPAGPLITHAGRHPNTHPLKPLLWLADYLSSRGEMLKAGWVVTTGSYAGMLDVPLQTPLSISYGDLGKLEVTFEGE
jgi:2-keto-4-pentenoate hydratase